jgi:hypothetical protein
MQENPLWLLFMITTVISVYLSMSISADHESNEKSPVAFSNILLSL